MYLYNNNNNNNNNNNFIVKKHNIKIRIQSQKIHKNTHDSLVSRQALRRTTYRATEFKFTSIISIIHYSTPSLKSKYKMQIL